MQVRLLKPHTHAGRHYPPDALLDLDKIHSQWLIDRGIAKAEPAKKEPKSTQGE